MVSAMIIGGNFENGTLVERMVHCRRNGTVVAKGTPSVKLPAAES